LSGNSHKPFANYRHQSKLQSKSLFLRIFSLAIDRRLSLANDKF
jgi:hypothetical protein